jgi:hypothetical protein
MPSSSTPVEIEKPSTMLARQMMGLFAQHTSYDSVHELPKAL